MLEVSTQERFGLIAKVEPLKVQTHVDAIYPFEYIVVAQQELTQTMDGIVEITGTIYQSNVRALWHKSTERGIARRRVASDFEPRLTLFILDGEHLVIQASAVGSFFYEISLVTEIVSIAWKPVARFQTIDL